MIMCFCVKLVGGEWLDFFFFQAEDGIRDVAVTGVQTCALPISARPPGTKNRGIRRPRDGARRGAPSRATRPGRYRADEREMPRRAPRELDSRLRTRFALWSAHAAEGAGLYSGCSNHAGAWNLGQHNHLQHGERLLFAEAADSRS